MPTKTVVAMRTLHVAGPDYKAPVIDPVTGGHLESGTYDVVTVPPGETVKLDETEADRLIKGGLATLPPIVVADVPPAPAKTK